MGMTIGSTAVVVLTEGHDPTHLHVAVLWVFRVDHSLPRLPSSGPGPDWNDICRVFKYTLVPR